MFFCQAEDGIRDLVRSRGLGDVYKRQVVSLPGSKSLTNRYLVLSALAQEVSRLRAPLRSRDTALMAAALRLSLIHI